MQCAVSSPPTRCRISTPAVGSKWIAAMVHARHSVNAGRSLPIENVDQFPRVADEIDLQLSLLIHPKPGRRVQNAPALTLVCVVQVELASRQVVGSGSSVPVN